MADLKIGTTVGGSSIWHQGNFPLFPTNDSLEYKTFLVYTTNDKPQAADNDFVSKALGGEYLKNVNFKEGLSFTDKNNFVIKLGVPTSTSPMANYSAQMKLSSPFAFVNLADQPFIIVDPTDPATPRLTVMGKVIAGEIYDTNNRVFSASFPPTPADVSLGNVTNDRQVKLAGDTMTGALTAPNFSSTNTATRGEQVPRFDQVIAKNTEIDFGYY